MGESVISPDSVDVGWEGLGKMRGVTESEKWGVHGLGDCRGRTGGLKEAESPTFHGPLLDRNNPAHILFEKPMASHACKTDKWNC